MTILLPSPEVQRQARVIRNRRYLFLAIIAFVAFTVAATAALPTIGRAVVLNSLHPDCPTPAC